MTHVQGGDVRAGNQADAMRDTARGIARALIEHVEMTTPEGDPPAQETQPQPSPEAEPTDVEAASHDDAPTDDEAAQQADRSTGPDDASQQSGREPDSDSQLRMDL